MLVFCTYLKLLTKTRTYLSVIRLVTHRAVPSVTETRCLLDICVKNICSLVVNRPASPWQTSMVLWSLEVHYCHQRSSPIWTDCGQFNPAYIFSGPLLLTCFNVTILFHICLVYNLISVLEMSQQKLCVSLFWWVYTPRPSHIPYLNQINVTKLTL